MTDSTVQSGIRITDPAVAAVLEAIRAESLSPETTFLRVGVRAGGCSGYSYDLSFTEEQEADDLVIEQGGLTERAPVSSSTSNTMSRSVTLSGAE